jgi:hypothetical protein
LSSWKKCAIVNVMTLTTAVMPNNNAIMIFSRIGKRTWRFMIHLRDTRDEEPIRCDRFQPVFR